MSPTAAAILGLFFGLWAHEARHSYEARGRKVSLLIWTVGSVVALILLLWALFVSLLGISA